MKIGWAPKIADTDILGPCVHKIESGQPELRYFLIIKIYLDAFG